MITLVVTKPVKVINAAAHGVCHRSVLVALFLFGRELVAACSQMEVINSTMPAIFVTFTTASVIHLPDPLCPFGKASGSVIAPTVASAIATTVASATSGCNSGGC